MKSNKHLALTYLKQKEHNGLTYAQISELTGYSISYLKKLKIKVENEDIESLTTHGLIDKKSNNHANEQEINFIIKFKEQYPIISISQFQDIYNEQVIFNNRMKQTVTKYNLKQRSYSFFQSLFKKQGWKSPCKHKIKGKKQSHTLREPMPKRGILVMMDGTPHDWFNNGKPFSLHLAIDDATGEYLCGYFMPTERLEGYCRVLMILLTKYGIPENLYTDKHTIFKSSVEFNLTTFGEICEDLGINLIYANTPEAKGKIERANRTLQGRLLVDIKRYNIQTYQELNVFFNEKYCNYLNHKFAYEPKDKDSSFVKLEENFDLLSYMCIRTERKFLKGNVFSYNNCYYKITDKHGEIIHLYQGTSIEVRENIFNQKITVKYKKIIYNTVLIEKRNRKDSVQKVINDQKDLLEYFNNKKE